MSRINVSSCPGCKIILSYSGIPVYQKSMLTRFLRLIHKYHFQSTGFYQIKFKTKGISEYFKILFKKIKFSLNFAN